MREIIGELVDGITPIALRYCIVVSQRNGSFNSLQPIRNSQKKQKPCTKV